MVYYIYYETKVKQFSLDFQNANWYEDEGKQNI